MLNYPKVGRRPLQSDYRVSSSEIESYKKAKDKYEEEKRKRAEKNITLLVFFQLSSL